MRRALIALALLALAACGGGGAPSLPSSPTPPAPIPMPGVQVFAADWNAPLNAALQCGGSPFVCDLPAGAVWGVLAQPGGGGIDCVQPTPNVCFTLADGRLYFHSGNPGMALISARTFDGSKPISVRAVVNVTNDCSGVSYHGGVLYAGGRDDGDTTGGTYWAAYISCAAPGDPVKVWIYRPTLAIPVSGPVAPGEHELRIDYTPGQGAAILLDGIVVKPAGQDEIDPLAFPPGHDPHAALWSGAVDGYDRDLTVNMTP